ncbi:hypothetical protein HanRHA438_Chr14g0666861 [Helianthus annuus]|nr:hypothetical protein HanRHA438_Chr14g0666861 [Helianthus annuus]
MILARIMNTNTRHKVLIFHQMSSGGFTTVSKAKCQKCHSISAN